MPAEFNKLTTNLGELTLHLYMCGESVLKALNLKMLTDFRRNKLSYKDSTKIILFELKCTSQRNKHYNDYLCY